jgi:putative oxidoreductase
MSKQASYLPALSGLLDRLTPLGLPLLRLALGSILMVHGYGKFNAAFFGDGIGGLSGFITSKGLPAPEVLAWMTIAVEFGGGIGIFLGLFTRLFATLTTGMLIVILLFFKDLSVFKGGYEFELLIAASCFLFAVKGAETFSVDSKLKKTF